MYPFFNRPFPDFSKCVQTGLISQIPVAESGLKSHFFSLLPYFLGVALRESMVYFYTKRLSFNLMV